MPRPDSEPGQPPDYAFEPPDLDGSLRSDRPYEEAEKKVRTWLDHAAKGKLLRSDETAWLYDSGLFDAISKGSIVEHPRL